MPIYFLRQSNPFKSKALEHLEHSPEFPWLVGAVLKEADFKDLGDSEGQLQALEPYGNDAWDALELSTAFEAGSVAKVRKSCTYNRNRVCFYPVALYSSSEKVDLGLTTHHSSAEVAHLDEKLANSLAAGKLLVKAAARAALGSGYNKVLTPQVGVSLLALMSISLSNGSKLLGWGWSWYRKGTS